MNRPFSSGRTRLVGFGRTYPVPIPLDPAAHGGALAVGLDPADGKRKLYFCDGTEWTRSVFDTTISEQIERLISDIFLSGFAEDDLPDPMLAENLRRYAFNNTRGLPGFVWGGEWRYLADEARAAQIAADVAAGVFRVLTEDIDIEVGPGAEVEGQLYNTLGGALAFAANYFPNYTTGAISPRVRITIRSGVTLAEQIVLVGVNLAHVTISAVDAEVLVDAAALTRIGTPSLRDHNFIYAERSVLPTVSKVVFRMAGIVPRDTAAVAAGLVPADYAPRGFGLQVQNGSNVVISGDGVEKTRWAGFTMFHNNIRIATSSVATCSYANADNAQEFGFRVEENSTAFILSSVARGAGSGGVLNVSSEVSFSGRDAGIGESIGGATGQDFRKVPGVDSALDVQVFGASSTSIPATFRGGTNIEPFFLSGNGIIYDSRTAPLPRFFATAAELPSPAAYPFRFTTAADTGPVWSNGAAWFPLSFGAPLP